MSFTNINVCKSETKSIPAGGALVPLLNQECSEIFVRNIGANSVLIYQLKADGTGPESGYFALSAGHEFTFRGITKGSDLSASSTSGTLLATRTQFFSFNVR
jgi:hypothetical protein